MTKTRILVVEDDGIIGLSLQTSLEKLGYEVPAVAISGAEAIQLAQDMQPHLVIMDIRLDGPMDGIETAIQLRGHFDLPIIYLTANSDDATLQRAKQTRFFGYLLKPFDERELYATIEMALAKHQLEKQLELLVAERTAELTRTNQQLQEEIATREQAEARLLHHILHDNLTGLPNRTLLLHHLERSLEQARLQQGHVFAVLQLNLDRFKLINEGLGHSVGDQILMSTARRLEKCTRPGDTLAFLGEDNFVILLADLNQSGEASRLASQIQEMIATPLRLKDQTIVVTASIGIVVNGSTLREQPYERGEDILRDAEAALHQAKTHGRSRIEFFDIRLHARAVATLEMENKLRQALVRQEFQLYYQPIISLNSGHIVAVEALLRWQNPDYGFVVPEEFIPLLEEIDLIVPVGEWVFRTCCQQIKTWQQAGYIGLRGSINLSVRQLREPRLPAVIKTILAETELAVESIDLEVTESIAMQNSDFTWQILPELSNLGLSLAIDDFGIGYSSLDRLKRMPVSILKIDQSFIRDIGSDTDDAAIIAATIAMAHSLKLRVIAEGVETPQQLAFLKTQGCDEGQGYLFSPPVTAEAMTRLLEQNLKAD